MTERLKTGNVSPKEHPHVSELTLYSRPLHVTESRANRYQTAAQSVGATFWYKSIEGQEIDREKWSETLNKEGFGYVQLGYRDRDMWRAFCAEDEKLAVIEDAQAKEEQGRRFGVLRGTKTA